VLYRHAISKRHLPKHLLGCLGALLLSCSATEPAPPALQGARVKVSSVGSPEYDTVWGEPGAAPGAAWAQIYADERLQDRLGRVEIGEDGSFSPFSLGDNRLARAFVVAEDAKGRRGPALAVENDITPPKIALEASPPAILNLNVANFRFSCDEPGCAPLCKLDEAPLAPCQSPLALEALSPGPHLFQLSARDQAGNALEKPLPFSFVVDLPSLKATFTQTPTAIMGRPEAVFAFTCDAPPCAFECQLDEGLFAPCQSPHKATVSPGFHSLQVRPLAGPEATLDSTARFSWSFREEAP
jgi:hypothetical protein